MLEGNRCEICESVIPEPKSRYKQTKYCDECAKRRKREGALNSWPPDAKAAYMRDYMRVYRALRPRLSTPYVRKYREKQREASPSASFNSIAILLPFLVVALLLSGGLDPHSDALPILLSYLELLAVKITGFVIVIILCWKHLERFFEE